MTQRKRKLTRRTLLIGGGLAGCCLIGGVGGYYYYLFSADPISTVGEMSFASPLAIPPVAEPERDDNGRLVWDLALQADEVQLVPDGYASTWGVNGPFLAPTLRANRGDEVLIRLRNELPEDTTIHWHGMHLPAAMDGGPHQMIAAGDRWEPTWTIDQPAATLWYHPHPHGETAKHVYRGIAGLFLVDDPSDDVSLPNEYGVDDVPLIIQDKNFTDDGDLDFDVSFLESLRGGGTFGILGDTILVNGTYDPTFAVTRTLTRFRILNGSNARFYNLGFDDDRPFTLVATDNGYVPGELPQLTRLLLGPGERAEIVVEFAEGDEAILRSYEQDLGVAGINGDLIGANDTFDILKLSAPSRLERSTPLPARLAEDDDIPVVPSNATVRTFKLDGHETINGERMDMSRIDVVVPAGALEVWEVESDGQPHTFHIHGATFHVLDVDGAEPPMSLRGPKDTVLVSPDHPVRLAVQFRSYTDPIMPYMYHCHLLRHEDNGMMGQFVVVEPGTEDTVDRTISDRHHH